MKNWQPAGFASPDNSDYTLDMTLNQISYFLKISECHSFSQAAQALFVSQPALTKAMRELESELGITLFYRSSKGAFLSPEGEEFLLEAKDLYQRFDSITKKYSDPQNRLQTFAVSTQHYSFAVQAFVELVQEEKGRYQFAIRETTTRNVISDVATLRSQIGLLYLSKFNRAVLTKILDENDLEFEPLAFCEANIYIKENHPLAWKESVTFEDLKDFPCLSFEQGDEASYYFMEELYPAQTVSQIIRVTDRATMINLMEGLHGYTICSGIVCNELNGPDCIAIPIVDPGSERELMQIGYIHSRKTYFSALTSRYIEKLKKILKPYAC